MPCSRGRGCWRGLRWSRRQAHGPIFPIKLVKNIDMKARPCQAKGMSVALDFTELADEFALVPEVAAEVGLPAAAVPRVRRGWVNVPTGGHVSGVLWGSGAPQVVFLHDNGASARAWDP